MFGRKLHFIVRLLIFIVDAHSTYSEEKQYKTTLRTCRAGDRGFAYINKS